MSKRLIIQDGNLIVDTALQIAEQAAAGTDVAAYGQFWVRNDTPNVPVFTDDAGTDFVLNASGIADGTTDGQMLVWDQTTDQAWEATTNLSWSDSARQLTMTDAGRFTYISSNVWQIEDKDGVRQLYFNSTFTPDTIISYADFRIDEGKSLRFYGTPGSSPRARVRADVDALLFTSETGIDFFDFSKPITVAGAAASPGARNGSSSIFALGDASSTVLATKNDSGLSFPIQNLNDVIYRFNSPTGAADPGGPGFMRANTGTFATITEFYFDDDQWAGSDVNWFLDELASGDLLTLRCTSDQTRWMVVRVGTPVDNTGWWTVPVTPITYGGGSIFINGRDVQITVEQHSKVPSASTVTVADTASASTFITMTDNATGNEALLTDAGLTYNATTATLTATIFSGALSGNATSATTATNVTVAASASATGSVLFTESATGNLPPKSDTGLTYNASTNALTTTTFIGALSGNATTATTLATGRTIAMTGDVAWTSPSFNGSGNVTAAGTIQPDSVTMDKIVDIATDTFLGRVTAATGTVEVLTNAQAKTALDLTGTNSGDQTITLTGDVGGTGTGSFAATIAADAVTYAKIQNIVANNVLLGNIAGAGGIVVELTGANVNTILPVFTAALNGLAPLSGGGTANFLRADGTWAAPAGGSGTVTSVSVVSANGFAGTVATATTTPAITLSTSINAPVLAGNGTAISAATTTGTGSTAVLNASPTITGILTVPTVATSGNFTINVNTTENALVATANAGTALYNNNILTANANIERWDIYSNDSISTSSVQLYFRLADTTEIGSLGYSGSDTLGLTNLINGGTIFIGADDAGGTLRTILSADPDGLTTLRGDNGLTLECNAGETALIANSNASVTLYWDNIQKFRTANHTAADMISGAEVLDAEGVYQPVGIGVVINDATTFDTVATHTPFQQANATQTVYFVGAGAGTANFDTYTNVEAGQTNIPVGTMWYVQNNAATTVLVIRGGTSVTIRYWSGAGAAPADVDVTVARGGVATIRKVTDAIYDVWGIGLS